MAKRKIIKLPHKHQKIAFCGDTGDALQPGQNSHPHKVSYTNCKIIADRIQSFSRCSRWRIDDVNRCVHGIKFAMGAGGVICWILPSEEAREKVYSQIKNMYDYVELEV